MSWQGVLRILGPTSADLAQIPLDLPPLGDGSVRGSSMQPLGPGLSLLPACRVLRLFEGLFSSSGGGV